MSRCHFNESDDPYFYQAKQDRMNSSKFLNKQTLLKKSAPSKIIVEDEATWMKSSNQVEIKDEKEEEVVT